MGSDEKSVSYFSFHDLASIRRRSERLQFFRQLPNSDSAIADEQTTALIKRHMANLLYPVDMGSFARPETDTKFREQIIALQKADGGTSNWKPNA